VIVLKSLDILDYAPRFQFGQAGVPWSLQKVACTDTCVQMIIHYFKDRLISLNEVRRDSGQVPGRGLKVSQSLRALQLNGVSSYRWDVGYNRANMISRLKLGPVIASVNYRYYPAWAGHCSNTTSKAEMGGKTDCYFTGSHAVLVIKAIPIYRGSKVTGYEYLVRDPDHDSPGRSEKPNYDRISEAQLKKAMEYITYLPGWDKPTVVYSVKKKTL